MWKEARGAGSEGEGRRAYSRWVAGYRPLRFRVSWRSVEMAGTNGVRWVEFRRWTGRWRDAVRLGLAPDVRLLGLNQLTGCCAVLVLCWCCAALVLVVQRHRMETRRGPRAGGELLSWACGGCPCSGHVFFSHASLSPAFRLASRGPGQPASPNQQASCPGGHKYLYVRYNRTVYCHLTARLLDREGCKSSAPGRRCAPPLPKPNGPHRHLA